MLLLRNPIFLWKCLTRLWSFFMLRAAVWAISAKTLRPPIGAPLTLQGMTTQHLKGFAGPLDIGKPFEDAAASQLHSCVSTKANTIRSEQTAQTWLTLLITELSSGTLIFTLLDFHRATGSLLYHTWLPVRVESTRPASSVTWSFNIWTFNHDLEKNIR